MTRIALATIESKKKSDFQVAKVAEKTFIDAMEMCAVKENRLSARSTVILALGQWSEMCSMKKWSLAICRKPR